VTKVLPFQSSPLNLISECSKLQKKYFLLIMSIISHFSLLGCAVGSLVRCAAVLSQVVEPPAHLAGLPSKFAVEIYKDSDYLPHPCASLTIACCLDCS
jgi:hypothetical protein